MEMDYANFGATRTNIVHRGALMDDGQLNHLMCGANGVYARRGRQSYRRTDAAVTCKNCLRKMAAQEAMAAQAEEAPAATPAPAQDAVTAAGPFHGVTVVVAPQTTPSGAFLMCELREGGEVPQARLSGLTTGGECGTLADWAASAGPAVEGSPSTIAACDFHLAAAVRYLTAIRTGDINPATGRSRDAEDLEARHAQRPPLREGGPEWEALTSTGPEPEFTRAGAIVQGVDTPAALAAALAPPAGRRLRVPIKLTASANRLDWAYANGMNEYTPMDELAADLYAYVRGQLTGGLPGMLEEADARPVDVKDRQPVSATAKHTPRFNAVLQFALDLDGDAWAGINGLDPEDTAALIKDVRTYVSGELSGHLEGLLGETEGKVRLWEA